MSHRPKIRMRCQQSNVSLLSSLSLSASPSRHSSSYPHSRHWLFVPHAGRPDSPLGVSYARSCALESDPQNGTSETAWQKKLGPTPYPPSTQCEQSFFFLFIASFHSQTLICFPVSSRLLSSFVLLSSSRRTVKRSPLNSRISVVSPLSCGNR